MYLYFDKQGTLKEIVNDDAIRQGNYGVNKMFVYVEDRTIVSIDTRFLMPDELVVGPFENRQYVDTQIPFNDKRDLLYFKYFTDYRFIVIDLEADINGNSPLDQAGVVNTSLSAILSDHEILQLGEVNFMVEEDPVFQQKYVATQEYLSLADYQFLRTILERTIVHFDDFPTLNSPNAVRSNGIKVALNELNLAVNNQLDTLRYAIQLLETKKQDKLVAGAGLNIEDYEDDKQIISAEIATTGDINNLFD